MAQLMGIINLTPDSFYSGSRFLSERGVPDVGRVSSEVGAMLADGASIIDFGAFSSRPGVEYCGSDEEWRRLEPVIRRISADFPGLRFSVDTFNSEIVRRVFDMAGDFIVNDISAGEQDAAMLGLCGELGLGYIAMHKMGDSLTMDSLADYPDGVVRSVLEYFKDFSLKASDAGLRDWILDPGFGFAKTVEQNYELLGALPLLKQVGRPILVGISRKSMVYKPFGLTPDTCLTETQVLHYAALLCGADILRVHDVAEAAHTVCIWQNLLNLRDLYEENE